MAHFAFVSVRNRELVPNSKGHVVIFSRLPLKDSQHAQLKEAFLSAAMLRQGVQRLARRIVRPALRQRAVSRTQQRVLPACASVCKYCSVTLQTLFYVQTTHRFRLHLLTCLHCCFRFSAEFCKPLTPLVVVNLLPLKTVGI